MAAPCFGEWRDFDTGEDGLRLVAAAESAETVPSPAERPPVSAAAGIAVTRAPTPRASARAPTLPGPLPVPRT